MRNILAMALAVATGPALADMGSSVQLAGLRYELVDLKPDDGVDPWFRYDRSGSALSEIFHIDDAYPQALSGRQYVEEPFGTTSLRAQRDASVAATAVQFSGGALSLSASGRAAVPQDGFVYYFNRSWATNFDLSVELGPHTAMAWAGTYTLDAWADPDPGLPLLKARASFAVLADETLRVSAAAVSDAGFGKLANHKEGSFSFLVSNATDSAVSEVSLIAVDAVGQRTTPNPVPEPATWLSMLAGLGVIGAWRQRRHGAPQPA